MALNGNGTCTSIAPATILPSMAVSTFPVHQMANGQPTIFDPSLIHQYPGKRLVRQISISSMKSADYQYFVLKSYDPFITEDPLGFLLFVDTQFFLRDIMYVVRFNCAFTYYLRPASRF